MGRVSKMISERLSGKVNENKAEQIRKNMPGFIGTDFAKKADDDDIIAMADLQDQKARAYNSHMKPIFDKMDDLRKKYKLGKMDRK